MLSQRCRLRFRLTEVELFATMLEQLLNNVGSLGMSSQEYGPYQRRELASIIARHQVISVDESEITRLPVQMLDALTRCQ
jgi:hypothetical protein